MKQVSLKAANQKKLELKKTAIANLYISGDKQKMLVGGGLTNTITGTSIFINTCTSNETI
jgi:hypothetical protein